MTEKGVRLVIRTPSIPERSTKMIERHLDYLQFSAMIAETKCLENEYSEVTPLRFYKRGYRDEYGSRLYYGNPNSAKALVVMSGQALEAMRGHGMTDGEIVQLGLRHDAEFSRLDLAVTEWVETDLIQLEDIQSWFTGGLISSSLVSGGLKEISSISENTGRTVETLYIGDMQKRGKKGIFRAYDKGIEINIGQYLATRLEYEDRGEKAHNSAIRLADTDSVSGVFRSRFDVKSRDFERLMDADALTTKRGKGKFEEEDMENERRWQWLMNQVAPSLQEAIETEQKNGHGDGRLTQFLIASGLGHLLDSKPKKPHTAI